MEFFDAAVLTMPVPQILQLPHMIDILDQDISSKLSKVSYASRYALGLFFDKQEASVILNESNPNISVRYIKGDPILTYVSLEGKRRGKISSATSVTFHARVPWSLEHLETPIPEVEKMLLDHCKKIYPNWPQPASVKCQRWRYSQVYKPFEGTPKAVVLHEEPLIVAGGDAFVAKYATVDDCFASARKISDIICSKNL